MPKKLAKATAARKSRKKINLAVIVLAILFTILVIGNLVRFVRNLFKPLTQNVSLTRNSTWQGDSNINLVIKGAETSFFSYNPIEKTVKILKIPGETYVEVPGGFGSWQIRSVYPLGATDQKSNGGQLLKDAVSGLVGMPIDGVVELTDQLSLIPIKEVVGSLRKNPVEAFGTLQEIRSNLTPFELLRLFKGINSVRFDKIYEYELSDGMLSQTTLPDGSEVSEPDLVRIDAFMNSNFYETKFRDEQVTIAVFNTTEVPGLALTAARMVSNMGGNVIITTNASADLPFKDGLTQTKVVIKDQKGKSTGKRLSEIFAPECIKDEKCAILGDTDINTSRAQIDIIMGKDFTK